MFRTLSNSVSRLIHCADPSITTAKAQWIPRAVHGHIHVTSHTHTHSHTHIQSHYHTRSTIVSAAPLAPTHADVIPPASSPHSTQYTSSSGDYEDADNAEYNDQWYDFSVNSDSVSFPLYTTYLRRSRRRHHSDQPGFVLAYLWKNHRERRCAHHQYRRLAAIKAAAQEGALLGGAVLLTKDHNQTDTHRGFEQVATSTTSSYYLQPIDVATPKSLSAAIDFALIGRDETDEKNNDHLRRMLQQPMTVAVTVDGGAYSGDVLHGSQHGHGAMSYANGDVYDGEWREGLMHGNGRMFYAECNGLYDGDWADGERHGAGMFRTPAETYVGDWAHNDRHGHGQLFVCGVLVYDGAWKNNQRTGFGIALYSAPTNAVYIGEWANGLMNGHGILLSGNGERWEGAWKSGEQETASAAAPQVQSVKMRSTSQTCSTQSVSTPVDSALSSLLSEVTDYQHLIDSKLDQMRFMLENAHYTATEVM